MKSVTGPGGSVEPKKIKDVGKGTVSTKVGTFSHAQHVTSLKKK